MAGPAAGAGYHARLYDAEGVSRAVPLEELAALRVSDEQMLWIDLEGADPHLLGDVWRDCGLPGPARAFVMEGTSPEVGQQGEYFWVRCVAVGDTREGHTMSGCVLHCVAGPNRVVSIHRQAIPFIAALREQRNGDVPIGGLSSESFVATLLDRQLGTYFEAVSDYERAIERLEVGILASRAHGSLPELQRLRRWASRMRRMLAPHRSVFGVMSRPDFRPSEGRSADRHFVALDTRFERAMDMVENARELVLGSFELFSSQTALITNDTMRVLTFVTVITGLLATVVGALGMNFDASFFKTQDAGFWWAVGCLAFLTAVALVLGRWRRWY
jgi:Mg2+ and Co2+ transporter CorA